MTSHRQAGPPPAVSQAGSDRATQVAFTRDGNFLITADSDGIARLWNVATRRS
jgi:WD40 repeat protein